MPSIFGRKRPLAENTLRRIARGIRRFVLESPDPFIVPLRGTGADHTAVQGLDEPLSTVSAQGTHHGLAVPFVAPLTHHDALRGHGLDEPMRTVTGAHRGEMALVAPFIAGVGGRMGQSPPRALDAPYQTITAKADAVLVAPTLVNTRNGERAGQAPRVRDLREPAPTTTAQGSQGAVAAALLKHFGGVVGQDLRQPAGTVTTIDHHALLTAQLGLPFGVVDRRDEVRAFLLKFYGNEKDGQNLRLPLGTVTTKDRFGLVYVRGVPYEIVDIGMRMLVPRELFRAQGFDDDYVIDPVVEGKHLTKTAQVRMCGNSVAPDAAAALVAANLAVGAHARGAA